MTVPSNAEAGSPPVRGRTRLTAIDATRAIAIIGMLVVHLSGVAADRWRFLEWPNGYASGGFAVLAGVSLGLTGRLAAPGWRVWPPQVVRSVLLFALGVWLAQISFGPVIILCVYAALFLVLLPMRRIPGRVLIGVGLALTLVSPVVSLWLRRSDRLAEVPHGFAVDWMMLTGPEPVRTVARTLVLDGLYPLLTWIPLAMAGWGAQRIGLLQPRRLRPLAVVAAVLLALGFGLSAVVEAVTDSRAELIAQAGAVSGPFSDRGVGVPRSTEWKALLTAGHHTGTTFELWQILGVTAGFLTVFSALTAAGPVLARAGSSPTRALSAVGPGVVRLIGWPGRVALSVYTAHIVVGWQLDERNIGTGLGAAGQAAVLAAYVAGAFALGAVFHRRRGPLEWLLHLVTRLVAHLVARLSGGSAPRSARRPPRRR